MTIGRCVSKFLSLLVLVFAVQIQSAAAEGQSNGFSDAFFNNVAINAEMAGLWNRSFDRCAAAGRQPVDDCVIQRAVAMISHGDLTGPRCAHVADRIVKHYCVVLGSIAADLVVKFELDSAVGFIKTRGDNFDNAIESAGEEIWSYLNRKCAASDPSANCLLDEVSHRLQPSARDIANCQSFADPHSQADCLIARWVGSRVTVLAETEYVGLFAGFFYVDRRADSALRELARRGQAKCERMDSAAGSDCLIDSVAAVLPYGNEMTQYCRDIADFVDRYLCVLTGALATDLYVKAGAGAADAILNDHGKDGERTINEADALVIGFLAAKCAGTPGVPRCGPKEAVTRLDLDPQIAAGCLGLTEDEEAVHCLLVNRALQVLRAAGTEL